MRDAFGLTWIPAPTSLTVAGLLVHVHIEAGAVERQRRRQAADPGADDRNGNVVLRHRARTVGRMLAPPLDEAGGDRVTVTLPPDLSEQALSRALDAVHRRRRRRARADLRGRTCSSSATRSGTAAGTTTRLRPSSSPQTVEEIQAIVRIANEHRVPIWVSGVGKNNGYGGSSPRVRGSVVVNLRRMNRVLEINEELGLRGRRARGPLVRPLRGDSGGRPQADALRAPTSAGAASSGTRSTTGSPTSRTGSDR